MGRGQRRERNRRRLGLVTEESRRWEEPGHGARQEFVRESISVLDRLDRENVEGRWEHPFLEIRVECCARVDGKEIRKETSGVGDAMKARPVLAFRAHPSFVGPVCSSSTLQSFAHSRGCLATRRIVPLCF